jgi:hypothetical protein
VAQEETLMMIRASITIGASLSAMVAASLGSSVWQPVDLAREERKTMHIHEEKVFVQLEEKEDRDSRYGFVTPGPRTICQGPGRRRTETRRYGFVHIHEGGPRLEGMVL